ncbi:GntR family transcriptional regulator [Embleya hyalina]|uniref:GntR family transcriptional regulator n=1 Tax=Embleya hyalina TaxID=516124 RepID=A0A401YGM8_9ACTN|nr:GntR family transcriptional regulator [Embleya hyalina]GCD93762.1 GntR family transcriptional regulator [Embleya hyalina]
MSGASPRGTYLTIADALRHELDAPSATRAVLSESGVQARFGVSRTTARRALGTLAEEGLIEPRKGIGWQPRQAEGQASEPLHERILADLAHAVRQGELAVGDAIRSEAELAGTFGVSRGKVRQALAYLEGMGVVTAVPGKARQLSADPKPAREADSAALDSTRSVE